MYPVLFEVSGVQVASYGICMVLGAVAAWFLARGLARMAGMDGENVWMAFLICVCGGLTGAFLFRPLTRIPEIFVHWESFSRMSIGVVMGYLFGEAVFYGGLLGGAAALFVFCGRFSVPALPMADLFAPAVALAHAFGRAGCFLGGCCYGMEVRAGHPLAARFPPGAAGGAPAGVPLLAVQLVEAACLLLICAVLAAVYVMIYGRGGRAVREPRGGEGQARNDGASGGGGARRRDGLVVCLYGILYGILRFVLEFYRGDPVRGVYGPFSTSQYVSMMVFCAAAAALVWIFRKNVTKYG